jgi:hypothetical protein
MRLPFKSPWYVLKDKRPVRVSDVLEWERFFSDFENRRVAFTELAPGVTVSTVFLGIDHSWRDSGAPILFETMSFDDYGDSGCRRYTTWAAAEAGHLEEVDRLRAKLGLEPIETSAGDGVLTRQLESE